MRDITLEDTFRYDFTTRAFATGIPTTLAGTPVLSVHEEANDTFITSGVSIDVDIGASAVTGLHEATIVATAANGYENGKSYSIFISTGTVGGVSVVGEIVGNFTIGLSAAAVDLANGTDGLGAIKTDTAAILVDTATTLDTKINDIQGATFSSATDSLEAIRDRGDAAWTTGAGGSPPTTLQNTTINTLASQTSFTLVAGSTDDDAYNGMVIIIEDSATATQKAVGIISDYTGSTRTVTLVVDPSVFAMAAGDTVDVIAGTIPASVWADASALTLSLFLGLKDI